MKYQLVLQFAAASMEHYDRLVALEKKVIGELEDLAKVDSHDFDVDTFNIFILTDDPVKSFGIVLSIYDDRQFSRRRVPFADVGLLSRP